MIITEPSIVIPGITLHPSLVISKIHKSLSYWSFTADVEYDPFLEKERYGAALREVVPGLPPDQSSFLDCNHTERLLEILETVENLVNRQSVEAYCKLVWQVRGLLNDPTISSSIPHRNG